MSRAADLPDPPPPARRLLLKGTPAAAPAEDGRTDVLGHHARRYKENTGAPRHDPDRRTRIRELGWKADGTPDFGIPVADGATAREA
ncbi:MULTISPECIES: hypothetical protein [unclassified Streptomyces]|uniref:hypothetical protein n=1 Tax=unclassified Streptomyces TaxID=2593676 RepID=UPI003700F068